MIRNCAAEQNLEGVAGFGDEILNGRVENGGFFVVQRGQRKISRKIGVEGFQVVFWSSSRGF
jgi:hypothetical protein